MNNNKEWWEDLEHRGDLDVYLMREALKKEKREKREERLSGSRESNSSLWDRISENVNE